jgi:hypothetical protein
MLLAFPFLCVAVLAFPFVLWRLQRQAKKSSRQSWGRYEAWRDEHFDQTGRCRRHPWYDGGSLPATDQCAACAILHNTRPYGDGN